MKPSHSSTEARRHGREAGIGLVEILVAVTLGMVGSVAMFAILDAAETRKRSASSASETEVAGLAGGYSLERELKTAGFGFVRSGVVGCPVTGTSDAGAAIAFDLVPVTITQGAGGPDTVEIVAGGSPVLNDPVRYAAGTPTTKDLVNAAGFEANEWTLLATGVGKTATCRVARISATAGNRLTHASLNGLGAEGVAVGLGPRYTRAAWTVAGNRLLRTDTAQGGAGTPEEVSDVIIDLQAQYGYDADGNGRITTAEWLDTLPVGADPLKVIAIRFATLSRSGQFESTTETSGAGVITRAPVTTTAPSWLGGAFTMKNVDGTADSGVSTNPKGDPNNWRYYRYRVHQFVVPLRNLIWGRT
jgi:type IV pilus assembly protein PilW